MRPPVVVPKSENARRLLEKVDCQQSILDLSLDLWQLTRNLRPLDFNFVEILSNDSDDIHGQAVRLSISHDGEYVVAMCLASEIS